MTNRQNTDGRGNYFEERAGTQDARFHVVPDGKGDWAVKEEGKDKPFFTSNKKTEAVNEAKKQAKEANTKAIVHDTDGKIEEQVEYDQ